MKTEFAAHTAMESLAQERARWAAVLGEPKRNRVRPRKTLWQLVFGF